MEYICPKCTSEETFKSFHPYTAIVDGYKEVILIRGYCDNCGTELEIGVLISEVNDITIID